MIPHIHIYVYIYIHTPIISSTDIEVYSVRIIDSRMRLDEIEDMAPIEWLARWQLKALEALDHGTENLRARPWGPDRSIDRQSDRGENLQENDPA